MKATYDPEADAMSVDFIADGVRARTVKTSVPGILLHLDRAGHLLELEIIGASEYIPRQELERLSSPAIHLTLTEAAREAGLSAAGLRVLVHKKKIPAQKRGRDWVVTRAELWTYLENRDARGAKPASRKAARARRAQVQRRYDVITAKKKTPAPTS